MRFWLMQEGNAFWNRTCHQWTSKEQATEYTDSEVDEIELTGNARWVIDYTTWVREVHAE
jgi:hypothetical protein